MAYLLSAEFVFMSPSKAEILIFRRGHKTRLDSTPVQDEESGFRDKPRSTQQVVTSLGPQDSKVARTPDNILHWKDLTYDISIKGTPRRILDRVDGWVRHGTLTALMVCIGAWKERGFGTKLMRQ